MNLAPPTTTQSTWPYDFPFLKQSLYMSCARQVYVCLCIYKKHWVMLTSMTSWAKLLRWVRFQTKFKKKKSENDSYSWQSILYHIVQPIPCLRFSLLSRILSQRIENEKLSSIHLHRPKIYKIKKNRVKNSQF